jgi:hypothetical protein
VVEVLAEEESVDVLIVSERFDEERNLEIVNGLE